jgi:hypothetical protein
MQSFCCFGCSIGETAQEAISASFLQLMADNFCNCVTAPYIILWYGHDILLNITADANECNIRSAFTNATMFHEKM